VGGAGGVGAGGELVALVEREAVRRRVGSKE
jgi:hypothetical protein